MSKYVLYAEIKSVKVTEREKVADIEVLEQFKGNAISSVNSSADSCGLYLKVGDRRVFFLTERKSGHALAYPWGNTQDQILQELRRSKQ